MIIREFLNISYNDILLKEHFESILQKNLNNFSVVHNSTFFYLIKQE